MITPIFPDRPLETQRLVLEPIVAAHARLVYDSLQDPEVYRFIPQEPPNSLEALEKRYELLSTRVSPDATQVWLNWATREKESGTYVGVFEATVYPDRTAEIAYTVFHQFWRRGFATEACGRMVKHLFNDYGVTQIAASMDTRNMASIRLAEKIGLQQTSFTKDADFFKDCSSDEFRYELNNPTSK